MLPSITKDDDHLRYAAEHGFVLLARNRRDYELLHHAWRSWSQYWRVLPVPTHAGILITPGRWNGEQIADEVARFLQAGAELTNALYVWTPLHAWRRSPDPPERPTS